MEDDRDFDADAASDLGSTDVSEAVMAADRESSGIVLRDNGSVAAQEILQTISQLMNTLNTERQVVLVAEERRREALVELAKLQGELEAERRLRERAEEELQRLRDEHAERRRRAEAELARLHSDDGPEALPAPQEIPRTADASAIGATRDSARDELERALSDEQTRRHEAEAQLERIEATGRERRWRAREELDRRRHQGAAEELVERAKIGLERVLGESLDEDPKSTVEQFPELQGEQIPAPQGEQIPAPQGEQIPVPPAEPERESLHAIADPEALGDIWMPGRSVARRKPTGAQSTAGDPADASAAPPLPPAWRYASDLPPSANRRRFRLRRRPR